MFIQFLMNDVVNQKSTHERPIESLEEATCFQRKLNAVPPGQPGTGIQTQGAQIY